MRPSAASRRQSAALAVSKRRRAALRVGVLALLASVLHVTLSAYSCGDPVEGLKSEGEPCTRSSECAPALACTGGVCRGLDAGPDGSTEDAALEDAAAEDAGDDAA